MCKIKEGKKKMRGCKSAKKSKSQKKDSACVLLLIYKCFVQPKFGMRN